MTPDHTGVLLFLLLYTLLQIDFPRRTQHESPWMLIP